MNTGERFANGLIIGRFQTFHLGHEYIVRCGLKVCERVMIYIGSSQESGTEKNPFSYEVRKDIIQTIFKAECESGRVIVAPLPDAGLGNNCKWGRYVLQHFTDDFAACPDVLISGKEERRISWFDGYADISELYVPKILDLSATKMRNALLEDDEEFFRANVSEKIWDKYPALRAGVLASVGNAESASM